LLGRGHGRRSHVHGPSELPKSDSKIKNEWAAQGTFSAPQTPQKKPRAVRYPILTRQKEKIPPLTLLPYTAFRSGVTMCGCVPASVSGISHGKGIGKAALPGNRLPGGERPGIPQQVAL